MTLFDFIRLVYYISLQTKTTLYLLCKKILLVFDSINYSAEFSDQVTESRQQAEQAALDVPGVQEKVALAEESITSISEELTTASDKAKEARDLAQKAQKEYADKASEVFIS